MEPSIWVQRNCRATTNSASTSFVLVKSKSGLTFCVQKRFTLWIKWSQWLHQCTVALSKVPCHISTHWVYTAVIQSLLFCRVILVNLHSATKSCRLLLVCVWLLALWFTCLHWLCTLIPLCTELSFSAEAPNTLCGSVYRLDSCVQIHVFWL